MSEVSICNQALSLVGANLITSLDDASTEAKLCKLNYGTMRDAVLQAHDWTFAKKWYDLPAMANPPVGEYANAFPMPTEILTVLGLGDSRQWNIRWAIEGENIVTDDSSCKCLTIVRIEDTTKFPPLFTQALSARLAAELSIPIVHSRTLMQDNFTLYERKVQEAATRDSQQGTAKRIRSTWLLQARNRDGARVAGPYV